MAEEKLRFQPIHIVRCLQALLSLLTLALLAHVAQWYNTTPLAMSNPDSLSSPTDQHQTATHAPNEVAYAIFISVLTILVTLPAILLIPRYFPRMLGQYTKHAMLVTETLSMILWFAAFVSVAAMVGKLDVCKGHVCTVAKVGVGMAAVSWVTWGVTSLFALRFCLGSGVKRTDVEWQQGRTGLEGRGNGEESMKEKVLGKLKGRFHAGWLGGREDKW